MPRALLRSIAGYAESSCGFTVGFAGVTQLQELILIGLAESKLSSWITRHKDSVGEANFLGQFPLHLAVGNIHIVSLLVELGHDLNVTDRWGITPLMYAAALGYEDVVVRLLSEGAKPSMQEHRFKRTFLDFAITYGHWDLVLRTLSRIQELHSHETFQKHVTWVVFRSMSPYYTTTLPNVRKEYVSKAIELCNDVNFKFDDPHTGVTGNNLMHYVQTLEEAEALVHRGFDLFNHPNSDGKLAIHSMVDSQLTSFCIDHGTFIAHVDTKGQTILLDVLSRLDSCSPRRAGMVRQIRCCLARGADPHHADRCRCPCSPEGCSSAAIFALDFEDSARSFSKKTVDSFWIFEWISTLQEFRGQEAARNFLLSFIRRIKFDELGMTHVCCHRGAGTPVLSSHEIGTSDIPRAMDETDVDDVLEKEKYSIDMLDDTMRNLASQPVCGLLKELMDILKIKSLKHQQRFAEDRKRERPPMSHDQVRDHAIILIKRPLKNCRRTPAEYCLPVGSGSYKRRVLGSLRRSRLAPVPDRISDVRPTRGVRRIPGPRVRSGRQLFVDWIYKRYVVYGADALGQ